MTNEQAIDRLRKISEKTPIRTNGDDLVAITMAIQAMLENEELSKDLDEALKEIDGYERGLSQEPTEKPMCDRNICISNEYNGIRCDECIVNKVEQEPYICDTCKHKDDGWDTEPCDGCCGNHSGYEPCEKNHEEKPHSLLDAYFQMRFESCAEQEPTSEMVHVETLRQVMWERDIAIEQLHELGYELGQKIESCDDAISQKENSL